MMPELSTPRLMLSQERPPASRREERSTAGERMLDRNRVLEEVTTSTRDRKDSIMSRKVMTSLSMFLEHQGEGRALAGRVERKYISRGDRRNRKTSGTLGSTTRWKQGVKSGSSVYQVMAESHTGPPHTSIVLQSH